VLGKVLVAVGLAGAVVSGGAVAFLRTDFVANNLCAYAVATIEEATAAQVKVARCSVEPEKGKLTIEGLEASDPSGRVELRVMRVFAQVVVRPLLQRVRFERLEIDHPEVKLSLDQAGSSSPPAGGQCVPDLLDRFEFGRVKVRKASFELKAAGVHVQVPHAGVTVRGTGGRLAVGVETRGGSIEVPGRTIGLISTRTAGVVDLRGAGSVELKKADLIGTEASAFVKGTLQGLCDPSIDLSANLRVDDLANTTARLLPGVLHGVKGSLAADATEPPTNRAAVASGASQAHEAMLTAHGTTDMAGGVNQALDLLQQRKRQYASNGVPYYRPWAFLITDGEISDPQEVAELIFEAVTTAAPKLRYVAGADARALIPAYKGMEFEAFKDALLARAGVADWAAST